MNHLNNRFVIECFSSSCRKHCNYCKLTFRVLCPFRAGAHALKAIRKLPCFFPFFFSFLLLNLIFKELSRSLLSILQFLSLKKIHKSINNTLPFSYIADNGVESSIDDYRGTANHFLKKLLTLRPVCNFAVICSV